ncbi:hypothetical protein [Corynebacterium sp. MSK072]|uniref:hypothetical protein n=1 Tax=Corynebacterium rhinophilum TaxID=3050197 RepID=UPI00254D9F0C|nr:hypothetical protein [Corynebacterium sp. MSK072]MDK8829731.1 hypothetical protein [Corynebacterium sp. MSK072]
MTFAEHTKRNWLITLFAAIFLAAIVCMIFLNDPHRTMVVAMVFIASAILLFGAILGTWYLFRRKDEKDPQ